MHKKISILGCGWLGLPLATFLVEKNIQVKGSTTRTEKAALLEHKGIKPYLIQFTPELGESISEFLDADVLIINIPPGTRRHDADYHVRQMKSLISELKKTPLKNILYVSSTSVYPDLNRKVTEEDVITLDQADNKTLFLAEELFRRNPDFHTLILRCAGLAGYDRNLVKHFAGKEMLPMGNAPVNLIHRDDVIQIIWRLLERDIWNETYNASAPEHPLRKELYPALAEKYKFAIPHYDLEDASPYKIIDCKKLNRDLAYSFKFPDPLDFLYN